MSNERIAVIWNPSKVDRDDLEQSSLEAGLDQDTVDAIVWIETSEDDPGQGAAATALREGASTLVVAGGDGTVRAVLEHLASSEADIDVALVPQGTGNLLARNLEVPIGDLTAALKRAFEGEARPIDIGWVELQSDGKSEQHGFAVMAGYGIDAQMIAETDDDLKGTAGWLAYVESLGRAATALEEVDVQLAIDEKESSETAHTVIVGNCGTLQGGLRLLPDADVADGLLDVVVLHKAGIGGWLDTLRATVWENGIRKLISDGSGEVQDTDNVSHRQGERVRLQLSSAQPFEIDGEVIGQTANATAWVQQHAVRIR